ncbi:hypothetical protein K7X08_026213 [Anisodus acutangulus]|uniref:Uncharacterized protein n=1 Tax=Anisodus acutangulus TaxID=402998 RepID=A0A9Q1N5T5_9SOLA|nr:hypothetical protein K7X08_026213 [Anisodus acutangulus]
MERDYKKNCLPYDDEVNDPIIDNLKRELEGMTVLLSSKHASKAPSRLGKETEEVFDMKVTISEDIGDNSIANDDGGHVGVGTSRDRVESMQAPMQKFGINRSSTAKVEKVDVLRPAVEIENVDIPVAEFEKVVLVSIAEVEKAPKVPIPVPQVTKVVVVPVMIAQVEKAVEVPVPVAHVEKTSDVPVQMVV